MKKLLNKIWDEFIYGGHILSLGASSIVLASGLLLNIKVSFWLFGLVYFGTHSTYLFDRVKDLKKDAATERSKRISMKLRSAYFMIFGYLMITILILCFSNYYSFLLGAVIFSSGYLYNIFFKSLSKTIPSFKNFFVPIPYALLPILLIYYDNQHLSYTVLLIMLFIYLRLFIAVAFYDLKDLNEDKKNKVLTLAVIMQPNKFKILLNIMNILSAAPILFGVISGRIPNYALAILLVVPYFSIYLYNAKKSKNLSLYSYIFCDGEYLFWFPIILLAKVICNSLTN